MEKADEALILSLLPHGGELKSLYEEHVRLEQQLGTFQERPHLSNAQQVEKKRLQKLKLAGMDQIMSILAQHRSQ